MPANPERDEQTVLGDLIRDSEALPAAGPAPVPVLTAFDKIQVVLEHVDAAGRRHPVVYRGTPGQHAAWETIARIHADVKAETKGDE